MRGRVARRRAPPRRRTRPVCVMSPRCPVRAMVTRSACGHRRMYSSVRRTGTTRSRADSPVTTRVGTRTPASSRSSCTDSSAVTRRAMRAGENMCVSALIPWRSCRTHTSYDAWIGRCDLFVQPQRPDQKKRGQHRWCPQVETDAFIGSPSGRNGRHEDEPGDTVRVSSRKRRGHETAVRDTGNNRRRQAGEIHRVLHLVDVRVESARPIETAATGRFVSK